MQITPPRPCLCGCGRAARKAFRVGHNGELMSRLLRAARRGDYALVDGEHVDPGSYAAQVSPRFADHFNDLLDRS